jgi:glycosyltransferase 2 family protein
MRGRWREPGAGMAASGTAGDRWQARNLLGRWRVPLQVAVALLVLALVARKLAENWQQYRHAQLALALRPGWIAVSVAALVVVSFLQIESWRRIIAGWHRLPGLAASARVWFLSNLGRYIPGKVWSVAGMVVLAEREGIPRWTAAGSAVAVQALGIGTAAALVALATPHAYSPLRLAGAVVVAVGTVGLLAWKETLPRVGRLLGSSSEWRALPLRAVLASAVLTFLAWAAYGLAFWALGRGLGLPPVPLATATGVFTLGYVVGLLVLFAPGGIGFREAILFTLLTPFVGSGGALALSVASRLELTLAEATAGLAVLAFARRQKEELLDATRR